MRRVRSTLNWAVSLSTMISGAGLVFGSGACTASGQANAKLSTEVSLGGSGKLDEIDRVKTLDAVDAEQRSHAGESALLGARHDVELKPKLKGAASCACIRVALGQPNDAAFVWETAPPAIDASTQLVFAMSSKGVECSGEPEGSRGASYEGYVLDGGDVVVRLEDAREGPPMTFGAIIPRPKPGSAVYVKPYKKGLPYGRALDGQGRCRVWATPSQ